MKISNEEKENLIRVEKAKTVLSDYLLYGVITDIDLIKIFNEVDDYGLKINKTDSNKDKMLKQIFNSPFLLCGQENLSEEVKDLLPQFLKRRYDMELDELSYLLSRGSISYEEYLDKKRSLKIYYYFSSKEGKKIYTDEKMGKNKKKILKNISF